MRLCDDGVLEFIVDGSEALFSQLLELLGEGGGEIRSVILLSTSNDFLVAVRATTVPGEEL